MSNYWTNRDEMAFIVYELPAYAQHFRWGVTATLRKYLDSTYERAVWYPGADVDLLRKTAQSVIDIPPRIKMVDSIRYLVTNGDVTKKVTVGVSIQ